MCACVCVASVQECKSGFVGGGGGVCGGGGGGEGEGGNVRVDMGDGGSVTPKGFNKGY